MHVVPILSGVTECWQFRIFPSPHSICTLKGMPKAKHARAHAHNEKLRREARLQKIVKKAKKRAAQGGAPAAEV
jgi:hypothetical protein